MIYQIIIVLVGLIVAYIIGTYLEKKHYQSIIRREEELRGLPVVASKLLPEGAETYELALVTGNVAVSVDYFKRFLASLHNFFGGRVTSYETLLDRARREAVLRMKEDAFSQQATLVLNVKYETASIYKGSRGGIGSVEVLAYGTGLIPKQDSE